MSQTFTISTQALMLAPPALLLAGGLIVGVALRGYLTTGIEVARLNAVNDARTARWLWKRGYRKTPEAGPDLTEATPELPALPAHPHVEESAPDRTGMWRVLLGLASDLVDRAHDWLPNLLRQWRERNDVGTGETAVAVDRFERFRIDDSPRGRCQPRTDAEIRAELAELTGEPEPVPDPDAEVMVELAAWVAANPPTNPSYKSHRCPDDVTADRDLNYRSRHTAAGFETGIFPAINIPAQRSGDVDA